MNIGLLRKTKQKKEVRGTDREGHRKQKRGDTEFEEISFDTVEKGEASRTPG